MVLASNEWLNNCEDDQKSTSGNSQTASATTGNNETAVVGAPTSVVPTTQVSGPNITTIIESTATPSTLTAARSASANCEIMSENPNNGIQQQRNNSSNDSGATALVTDVYAPNSPEIVNNNSEVSNCDASNENSYLNAKVVNAISNSNASSSGNASGGNNVHANAHIMPNLNTNTANLYSNPNSNASTLQSAIVRQSKTSTGNVGAGQQGALIPHSGPITPQALSSALQAVMNSSNIANATNAVVGNLQNSFLSTLGMDIGGTSSIALQQAAKQLTSGFCGSLVEVQTNMTNSTVHNLGSSSVMSLNLDAVQNNGQAKIVLLCEANSHPFQTRTILLTPNIECKVGRLIAKSKASESNAIFDCKVLSRNHAVLWYSDDGKFWVKDTKSSNGTFINENKLGTEAAELHFGDIVKFGVDVLENSRKEVHGCIIAFVKLYLADGREAISIDAVTQRSQYSGEGRISYEEMHRLNLYMQEVSQREKALKSKLFNIQNVLDATRKNSALCWQSLIAEDQLLHRINSLEKKLQIMEKNAPDSALRNEVLKLLEDKNSYQLTAKEALRKVYQERCDALQLLSKMESAYATSDGECKILRDQILNTKQSLQDVNTRLQRLEADYNEYKGESERKQQEIKDKEEQRISEMAEKLHQREMECEDLRRRVSEFMRKRAELVDEEEKRLQLQAIEKLDAVIDVMDLGEDDDEEDENDDDAAKINYGDGDDDGQEDENEKGRVRGALRQPRESKSLEAMNGVRSNLFNSGNNVNEKEGLNISSRSEGAERKSKQQRNTKESTILKWLQNSDLNEKEGSLDIIKAICNESDSSDERDVPPNKSENAVIYEAGAGTESIAAEEIKLKCKILKNKLHNVRTNLSQLEVEMANEGYKSVVVVGADHNIVDNEAEIIKVIRNRDETSSIQDDQKLLLLKRSVAILSEAYTDICDSLGEQEPQKGSTENIKEISTSPTITVQTLHPTYNANDSNRTEAIMVNLPDIPNPVAELPEHIAVDEQKDPNDVQSLHEVPSIINVLRNDECNTAVTKPETIALSVDTGDEKNKNDDEIRAYQEEIKELNSKLEQVESDAQNTLEIMQIECDAFKEKVAELTQVVQKACQEKQQLERILDACGKLDKEDSSEVPQSTLEALEIGKLPNSTNLKIQNTSAQNSMETLLTAEENSLSDFEAQLSDELASIDSNLLQREEELIVYKERLEKTQHDNVQLRNEIAMLQLKSGTDTQGLMVKQMIVYGAAVVAIVAYFITTYF